MTRLIMLAMDYFDAKPVTFPDDCRLFLSACLWPDAGCCILSDATAARNDLFDTGPKTQQIAPEP